ncbi:hypothetical protein KC8_15305 [Sphingomonas sp. KC8]|nr:hypothetical protein KC8_15305 [Sphingomonas sp. KC8]
MVGRAFVRLDLLGWTAVRFRPRASAGHGYLAPVCIGRLLR